MASSTTLTVTTPASERADLFRCPRTGAPLAFRDGRFMTGEQVAYPVEDGIVDFRCHRKDYYFNPVPRGAMADLTAQARESEWHVPVRAFLRQVKGTWLDNLVVNSRYAWKLLLDLPPDAQVLDLGCGLGNLTSNLAPHVGRVFAMDLTIERLRFAKERFRKFNANDDIVLVAGGDGARLPFPDHSLDVVALSGVLEWVGDDEKFRDAEGGRVAKILKMVGSFFGDRNPRAVQTRFLQEIRRVLKPSGQLFVGIENRLSHEYFYKRVDHHSGLRFGSLLPRFAANLYSIAKAHRPYRTYTYSIPGYRRLLRGAGFEHQRFYGLTPGYSELSELLALDTAEPSFPPRVRRGRERVTHHSHLVPAYGVIGTSSSAPPQSLLGRMMSAIEAALPSEGRMSIEHFHLTEQDRGHIEVRDDARRYVIVLPFTGIGLRGLARNREVLEALQGCPPLRRFVPPPPLQGELQGVHYFVERQLPGVSIETAISQGRAHAGIDTLPGLLETMNPMSERRSTALTDDFFRTEVELPLERLSGALDAPDLVTPFGRFLRDELFGRDLPRGLTHGDFSVSNLIMTGAAVTGATGWDYARLAGLPILDVLAYADSVERALTRRDEATHVEHVASDQWQASRMQSFVRGQYEAFGVDRAHHRALAYLQWVRRICRELDGHLIYDPAALDRRVVPVLKRFASHSR